MAFSSLRGGSSNLTDVPASVSSYGVTAEIYFTVYTAYLRKQAQAE